MDSSMLSKVIQITIVIILILSTADLILGKNAIHQSQVFGFKSPLSASQADRNGSDNEISQFQWKGLLSPLLAIQST